MQADWYPDPHGDGARVRWWDGDRWTEDTRPEHPRGVIPPPVDPPPAAPPGPGGGPFGPGRSRIVVSQQRSRGIDRPAYLVHDVDGRPLGSVVERLALSGRRERRAATLDMYDELGGAVYRLTRDAHLIAQARAAAGWPPARGWGYLVLDADHAPVAWTQAPTPENGPWHVHCLGVEAPIEIRSARISAGKKAPRPVTIGGAPIGQISVVSGWNALDSYLLDLFHGAPEGALATTLAAVVPLYDQVFRTVTPVRASASTTPASFPIG